MWDHSNACVAIAPAEFKQAGRRFASGVTVVTTRLGDLLHGATVSAFSTLSLEPMQILVSRAFATSARPTSAGAFPDVSTSAAATGAPIVSNCLAFFDCTVASTVDSGDHTIFIGDVQAVDAADGPPLIYFDGAYRHLDLAGEQP